MKLNSYEVRYKVPWTDNEQYVYGFKKKDVNAPDEATAKSSLPFKAYDIHITKVPFMALAR